MKQKIIISDWDGTLFLGNLHKTLENIKILKSYGYDLIISTGRKKEDFFSRFSANNFKNLVIGYSFFSGSQYMTGDFNEKVYCFNSKEKFLINFLRSDAPKIAVRFADEHLVYHSWLNQGTVIPDQITEIFISTLHSEKILSKYISVCENLKLSFRVIGDNIWIRPNNITKLMTPLRHILKKEYIDIIALGNDERDYSFLGIENVKGVILTDGLTDVYIKKMFYES